jgi:transposase
VVTIDPITPQGATAMQSTTGKAGPVFVGLDYHTASVQVCVLDRGGSVLLNQPCANDWRALRDTVARFGTDVRAALEACGGAADLAEELVTRAGWLVDLAHPGYVARMKGNPDKTDFSDARMLADLERVGYLPKVWHAPAEVRELRRLVRYRQQLVGERRNVKLRIGALLRDNRVSAPEGVNPWTVAWLGWLTRGCPLSEQTRWVIDRHLDRLRALAAEIKAAEERLAKATADDPLVRALRAMKGIGLVTAATLRAESGRFDRFRTGKQAARFCGLTPRNASSGQKQADAGLIKAGNPQLRATLIEVAHRLIRYEARWKKLAGDMKKRGKAGSVVAAALANRWVRWLFHQMQPAKLAA